MQRDRMMELLEKRADMVIKCDGGRLLPACSYVAMTKCATIRHVVEDTTLPKDDAGRVVVPFPNVPAEELSLALQLVHGAGEGAEWGSDSIAAALRGLDALGVCGTIYLQTLINLWFKVRGRWARIEPHVDTLVRCAMIRSDVLRDLVVLWPSWPDFRDKVLGAVPMDVALATEVMNTLASFFPIGPLHTFLLDQLPPTRTGDAMDVFARSKASSFCHPAEVVDVARAVSSAYGRLGTGATTVTHFLDAACTALETVDHVPCAATSISGTVIEVSGTPMVSMLMTVHDRKGGGTGRKLAPWLVVFIDWSTGMVDAEVRLGRLPDARCTSRVQVRLTAYGNDNACADLWYSVEGLAQGVAFQLADAGAYVSGNVDAFRGLVRSSALSRLRFDMFYARDSVFEKSFF